MRLPTKRTVSEIDGWWRKLETSGNPGLEPVAGNLAGLEELLTAEKLQPLSQLLTDEGCSVTEAAERYTTEGEAPGGRG